MKTKKAPSKKRTTAGRKPRQLTPVSGSGAPPAQFPIKGMKWKGADGEEHKLGLADYGDGSMVIVAEFRKEQRHLRLSPPALKILATLLISHLNDQALARRALDARPATD